jgi:hypothetical protein
VEASISASASASKKSCVVAAQVSDNILIGELFSLFPPNGLFFLLIVFLFSAILGSEVRNLEESEDEEDRV